MTKLIQFFLILSLFGCSIVSRKKNLSEAPVGLKSNSKLDQNNKVEEALHVLKERMESMIKVAKKNGPDAVNFLASDLFLKANDCSMRGDAHTASYLFQYLVMLKPEDDYIKRKYAIELIRMGNYEKAQSVLYTILEKDNYNSETLGLILGGVNTALDQKEKAREVYKKVLKKNPGSEEACVFLAKSYSLENKFAESHKLLRKCSKFRKRAVFDYYRAKIYLSQSRKSKAKKFLKKALEIDSTYYQAVMALGLLEEEREEIKKAIKIYKNFLKKNPRNYQVLSRIVQVLFSNEMFEEVLPYAELLSSMDQSDLNLRVRLGILYTDKKQYYKAIGVFKEILAAVPDSDKVLYYLGSLYYQLPDYEKALQVFGQITEKSSLYVDSAFQMARILQSLVDNSPKKWGETYRAFLTKRSQKTDELRLEFSIMLATYYEGIGEYSFAIKEIENVQNESDYTEGHDYYLASLYEKINEFKKARQIVKEILKKNPNNAHALNFLGYSLLESGEDLESAFKLINRAIELKPNDGYIRDSLGWYYYKTGQMKKALIEITKAFNLVSSDMVIAKHLAIIHKKMNNYSKAKQYFTKALKNCKFESEKEEIRKELKVLENLEAPRLPASSP